MVELSCVSVSQISKTKYAITYNPAGKTPDFCLTIDITNINKIKMKNLKEVCGLKALYRYAESVQYATDVAELLRENPKMITNIFRVYMSKHEDHGFKELE